VGKVIELDIAFRSEARAYDRFGRDPFDRFPEWPEISTYICNKYSIFVVELKHWERFLKEFQTKHHISRENLLGMKLTELVDSLKLDRKHDDRTVEVVEPRKFIKKIEDAIPQLLPDASENERSAEVSELSSIPAPPNLGPEAAPPKASRKAKELQDEPDDEPPATGMNLLEAAAILGAVSKATVVRLAGIVERAGYSSPDSRNVRKAVKDLHDNGYMASRAGNNGGQYVTKKGLKLIDNHKSRVKSAKSVNSAKSVSSPD
jgi:hypothetical protein